MYTLCLSGGGFRASLFHLGVVRRLIYLGVFNNIERINSISGGSIAAGIIMKELGRKQFDSVDDFDQRVLLPAINFIQSSPRKKIYRLWPLNRNSNRLVRVLDNYLYEGCSFSDLPSYPLWNCYATSLNSAMSWKFSQTDIGDSATGFTPPTAKDKIAFAVTASACFPPLLKPLKFSTEGRGFKFKWVSGRLVDVVNPSPPKDILLSDGGVYDNLGSESVLQLKKPFIISDASGIAEHWKHDLPGRLLKLKRPIDITMDQNGKLRRRLLYKLLEESSNGILIEASKPLDNYITANVDKRKSPTPPEKMPNYIKLHPDVEKAIGALRTDLNAFHDYEIIALLWNGMVKIDATIKRWLPHLIEESSWDDTPTLRITDFTEMLDILRSGSRTKIWGDHHKNLHFKEKLIENLKMLD